MLALNCVSGKKQMKTKSFSDSNKKMIVKPSWLPKTDKNVRTTIKRNQLLRNDKLVELIFFTENDFSFFT